MKIEEKLLDSRIIMLIGEINSDSANFVKMQLLYLDSINHQDIYLYIDSPGGNVVEGLSIIDTMNCVNSNVVTLCIGSAYSMASIILASGLKGRRGMLEHSEVMIHEASTEVGGKLSVVTNYTDRLIKNNKELAIILSRATGKPYMKVYNDMLKDNFMNAKEALKYGIIDKIIDFKSI